MGGKEKEAQRKNWCLPKLMTLLLLLFARIWHHNFFWGSPRVLEARKKRERGRCLHSFHFFREKRRWKHHHYPSPFGTRVFPPPSPTHPPKKKRGHSLSDELGKKCVLLTSFLCKKKPWVLQWNSDIVKAS